MPSEQPMTRVNYKQIFAGLTSCFAELLPQNVFLAHHNNLRGTGRHIDLEGEDFDLGLKARARPVSSVTGQDT